LDPQGRFTFISPVVEQLFAYKPEELIGQPLARFVFAEDLSEFVENLKRNLEHTIESFEFRILDRKGNVRYLRVSSRPLITNGQAAGLTGILSDVTAHKWAEDWLKKTQERYRSLFENALEGIFQSTLDGQFIIANPACARILGYSSPAELTAQDPKPAGLLFAEQANYREFKRLLAEEGIVQNYETQVFRQDKSKIWISLNALAIRSPAGAPLFYEGRMEDITERKWSEDRIYHLSFHDKLTGLYNRAYFEEELKRLDTDRQLPISVIFGDVNCLKLINDAFGHPEGDKLLTEIALILRESCRKEEVIARVGGDEFAIFLPKTSGGTTEEIVRRIKLSCSQKSKGSLTLSIALGSGTKERPSQDIQGILRDAEERMYKNKLLEGKGIRNSFILSFRRILFEKSYETEDHTRRIQHLALQIGRTLRLSDEELNRLTLLAAWHDIGYIALPEGILKKQGRLTEEEWKWIRKHPEIGYRIAESSPELASIGEAILAHHERWDGAGYPLGLKAETIPLVSRIVSIVDAYDVMINGRPYKPATTQQICREELQNNSGTQFDPSLVDVFLGAASKMDR
jgi:diguanylate cyclase (GGDEF)-like protein/PAS domain S-box-containing protein